MDFLGILWSASSYNYLLANIVHRTIMFGEFYNLGLICSKLANLESNEWPLNMAETKNNYQRNLLIYCDISQFALNNDYFLNGSS